MPARHAKNQDMNMQPVTISDPATHADAVAGYSGFLKWASLYGRDLVEEDGAELGGNHGRLAVFLKLSMPLSASFNFGYDASDQSIYIAVEPEEFDWVTLMPINEVLIGQSAIYILTRPIDLDLGEFLPPVVLKVSTNQPMLWHAFPKANDIGFMCVRANEGGYMVEEFHCTRYPLRFSN